MSFNYQIDKNLELSNKLFDYLISIDSSLKHNDNVSYIVISKENIKLNEANLTLAQSLVKKGKKIIKAIETGNKDNPWEFSSF